MNKLTITELSELGPTLKSIRKLRNVTLKECTSICDISISTLSMIEQGKQYPRLNTLLSYAQVLGVDEIDIKITNT